MPRSTCRFERLLPLTLVVSGLLHLAAYVFVLREEPAVAPRHEPVPIELTWQEVPPGVPPEPTPPVPMPPPRPKPSRQHTTPSAPVVAQPAQPAVQELPSHEPPRLITLVPRLDVLPPVLAPDFPRGRTLHPGELPSQAEVNAEAEARISDQIEGFARDRIAEARVEGGLVDPYFYELRARLRAGLKQVPDFSTDKNPARRLARAWYGSWKDGAERYGADGTPYEAPPGRALPEEVPAALEREVERGSAQARQLAQTLQAGARLRDFGDGRLGAELYAVVEIRQAGTGLEQVLLLVPSGVPQFDAWVLDRAETAQGQLGALDAGATGLRSAWAFTGRVSYRRSMKDVKLVEDGWYLALAAIPGLLTGNFDEVSGQVDFIDLRHPHYEARVKLLRAYDESR